MATGAQPGTPRRTITENRDEEADLRSRRAIVTAERLRRGDAKVIPPHYPRDEPAGDPASESGTKVSFDELDDALKALIGAGGGAVGALPFKEWDITAGAPVVVGDPLNIITGLFTAAGARTTLIASVDQPGTPTTGAAFQTDSRIDIWLDGQHMSLGPGVGTPRDVYWVSNGQIAFATQLKQGQTIRMRSPATF